jgi:hypothetical protein
LLELALIVELGTLSIVEALTGVTGVVGGYIEGLPEKANWSVSYWSVN